MPGATPGVGKTPGSGRKKGTANKIDATFKAMVSSILFDDPMTTKTKLEELRDSTDVQDRATFWRIASKLLPQQVNVDTVEDVLVILKFAGGRHGNEEGLQEIQGPPLKLVEGETRS